MKRKASKDISESPAKAPRSGETAAPADDHQDARSGAVTTSAGQQAAAAANEIAIGKEQIAEDTVSGGHGPKEDVQDENRKSDEEDGIERKVATKFIAKLQLVIESWRESSASPVDNADTTADCEQYLQDVLSICNYLGFLPGSWWREVTESKALLLDSIKSQDQTTKQAEELSRCKQAYRNAVQERGALLLGFRSRPGRGQNKLNDEVAFEMQRLSEARVIHKAMQQLLAQRLRLSDAACEAILRAAEKKLIWRGYLLPRAGLRGRDHGTRPASPAPNLPEAQVAPVEDARATGTDAGGRPTGDGKQQDERLGRLAELLLGQLQLVLERKRATRAVHMHALEVEKQHASVAYLCELAMTPGLSEKPLLKCLPRSWWDDIERLRDIVDQLKKKKQRLGYNTETLSRRSCKYDAAVRESGQAHIRRSDLSDQARHEHSRTIADALDALRDAQGLCFLAQEEVDRCSRKLESMARQPFLVAEASLADSELLRDVPKLGNHLRSEQRPRSPGLNVNDHRGTPQHASNDGHLSNNADDFHQASGEHDALGSPSRRVREGFDADWQRDERKRSEARRDNRPFPRYSLLEDVWEGQQSDLRRAARAWSEASREFHAVRDDYSKLLRRFLLQERDATDTKTVFDQAYFLRRNKANRRYTQMQNDYKFALKAADKSGALTVEQRVKLLGDSPEPPDPRQRDGDPTGGYEIDPIWEYTMNTVDQWRQDEEQRDITSECHWEAAWPAEVLGSFAGRSLNGLSDRGEQLASGDQRQAIDKWQDEQSKVRAEAESIRRVSSAAGDEILHWWEICDGIS